MILFIIQTLISSMATGKYCYHLLYLHILVLNFSDNELRY